MATHVADAAGYEADLTINNTARGDRFVNRIPGARSGAANLGGHLRAQQSNGRSRHGNVEGSGSGSSGSNERQRGGGLGLGPQFSSHLQARGFSSRGVNTGRKILLTTVNLKSPGVD
jgi:hypothetical protein